MELQYRISAGAIIIHKDKILLVKYSDGPGGNSYLVGPGGGVERNEGLNQAVIREVREETGLEVTPRNNRILFVEDLAMFGSRTTKVWFLCDLVGGRLSRTQGAKVEGINEVGWYSKEQLHDLVVYPPPLLSHDWDLFFRDNWETIYLEIRGADFDF